MPTENPKEEADFRMLPGTPLSTRGWLRAMLKKKSIRLAPDGFF
jgi:hypothetical protein